MQAMLAIVHRSSDMDAVVMRTESVCAIAEVLEKFRVCVAARHASPARLTPDIAKIHMKPGPLSTSLFEQCLCDIHPRKQT